MHGQAPFPFSQEIRSPCCLCLLLELALNTALFAKSLAMLGSSEDNTALSRALSQLAEVEEKIEQLHQEQANNDFFLLAELLSDYIRLLAIVRVSRLPSPQLSSALHSLRNFTSF